MPGKLFANLNYQSAKKVFSRVMFLYLYLNIPFNQNHCFANNIYIGLKWSGIENPEKYKSLIIKFLIKE